MPEPKNGEIWRISHTRKGVLDVMLISYDPADNWFYAEVVGGNNTPDELLGEKLNLSREFVTFLEKRYDTTTDAGGDDLPPLRE